MSVYGYGRETTPNLTALSHDGILFENAHANANWTLPSHVSIFTGLYPFIHKITRDDGSYLNLFLLLLPEVLQKNGYETYFFAPKQEANIPPIHVYNRGIAHWDDMYWDYRQNEKTYLLKALKQLDDNSKNNKKTFIFYHTYACHGPYLIENQPLLYTDNKIPSLPLKDVEVFNKVLTDDYYNYLLKILPGAIKNGDFRSAPKKIETFLYQLQHASNLNEAKQIYMDAWENKFWGETIFSDYQENFRYWNKINTKKIEDVLYIQALYDQRIHTMDTELFATLREVRSTASWSNNTIIIITADHGEEFMDHGYLSHKTLYESNVHIPFIALIPGMTKKTINEHIQSVDMTPTILDLVGIQNSFSFDGISLVPLLYGGSLGDRLILAEGQPDAQPDLLTIREGDWKLFVHKNPDKTFLPYELYDTKSDPGEHINVLVSNIDKAKQMIQKYNELKENLFIKQ